VHHLQQLQDLHMLSTLLLQLLHPLLKLLLQQQPLLLKAGAALAVTVL
jgi:hypothetical protein